MAVRAGGPGRTSPTTPESALDWSDGAPRIDRHFPETRTLSRSQWIQLGLVGLGGGVGSALRFLVGGWTHRLPIVIEIVDTLDKIEAFMPVIDEVIQEGVATLEKVEIRFYRSGG